MTPAAGSPDDLAGRLLDAQVQFVLAELSAEQLTPTIARAVDDVLGMLGGVTLSQLVDPADVKVIGRRLVVELGGSAAATDIAAALSDGLYDLGASDEHLLGDVLDRDAVVALVQRALALQTLSDRLLDRLTESPVVATVASRFVAKIVGDFMQQNRAIAEKVPGMSTVFNLGAGAASRVRGVTDRHVEQLLGDAAGKGASFALKRTNNAIREMLRDAPLEQAVLEIWDLHAGEPVGDLREYLSRDELREVVARIVEVVLSGRDTAYAGALVDTCVDIVFDVYGDENVADLLGQLGIGRDAIVADLCRLAPSVLAAARRDGVLEAAVRARLEPFFRSDEVRALLAKA
jgi:hypothetical protein